MTDPSPTSADSQPGPPPDRKLAIVCVLGILICIFMTFVELSRAIGGDSDRAWAYVLEWPAFGAFIVWIWRRLERRHAEEFQSGQDPLSPDGPGAGAE